MSDTGTFTSRFVLMIALALVGAVAILLSTKEPESPAPARGAPATTQNEGAPGAH